MYVLHSASLLLSPYLSYLILPPSATMEYELAHTMNEANYLEFSSNEEEEETLSLCELRLNDNAISKHNTLDDKSSKQSRRSPSSDASEFFDFFNDFSSDLCPADDIIFCGKLVPFKNPSPPRSDQIQINSIKKGPQKPPAHRRRSESLSKLQSSVTRSNSAITCGNSSRFMMRSSRSLDYRRLHRSSSSVISMAPEIERTSSTRSILQSEIVAKKAIKPRWYSLMFGTVKVPTEMELNDMKNRQVRRNPATTMFPGTAAGGRLTVNRSSGKVSWRILKALSCKDYTTVVETTSFPVLPAL